MRSSLKQLDPKSMILMLLLFGCFSKMFSGFKSQWMTCREASRIEYLGSAVCRRARYLFLLEIPQADEHLQGEAADERQGQPLELIVLNKLVPGKGA